MNDSSILTGSFMEPPTSKGLKGFHLGKRKRKLPEFFNSTSASSSSTMNDSTASIDLSRLDSMTAPDVKRKRSLSRMTSVISTPMAKMSSAFQRSLSSARLVGHASPLKSVATNRFLRSSSSVSQVFETTASECESPGLKRGTSSRNSASKLTPYKPPQPTPNKQRPTRFWSDNFPEAAKRMTSQDVKLQEAIYEIVCGEEDLVNDLSMIQKNYSDPLMHLNILNHAEIDLVFGKLKSVVPLHSELHTSLLRQRCSVSGVSSPIGQILEHWVDKLKDPYVDYCAGLIRTKAFIDHRRETDKHFNDFLQRCLESGFSRKLDLWSYLDVPRSKLVKYPLLLRQVIKFSMAHSSSTDFMLLNSAVRKLEVILKKVDASMAEARCRYTVSRLEWLDETVEINSQAVRQAREELLDGTLRNNRGTKLECHLLDTVLILGRPSSRLSCLATVPSTASLMSSTSTSSLMSTSSAASYHQFQQNINQNGRSPTTSAKGPSDPVGPCGKRLQVYRTPIPVEVMVVEELHSGASGQGSSFSESSSVGQNLNSSTASSGSKPGSFRSAFSGGSSNAGNRNGFRVSFRHPSEGQSHTLFAPDEHSKRQWMSALRKAIQMMYDTHVGINERAVDVSDHLILSKADIKPTVVGTQLSETDSLSRCSIVSPLKLKRLKSSEGKIVKLNGTPIKHGLFQKHKRSPRIKSTLSHTALESVMVGGAAKKIRTSASAKKLQLYSDENKLSHCSTPSLGSLGSSANLSALATTNNKSEKRINMSRDGRLLLSSDNEFTEGSKESILRRQPASSGSVAAAAVGKRILKQQLKGQTSTNQSNSMPAFRSRTKSWAPLCQVGSNASYHGDGYDNDGTLRRYNTRSATKKISKSMSDLLEM